MTNNVNLENWTAKRQLTSGTHFGAGSINVFFRRHLSVSKTNLNLIVHYKRQIFDASNKVELIDSPLWRVWSWLRTNAGGVPNTCKSSGMMKKLASSDFSGGRVSNTWATYLVDWDNSGKPGLIPNNPFCFMARCWKAASAVTTRWARGVLASW